LREPVPIHFPEEESAPESPVHFRLRTALFLVLEGNLRDRAYVGSDQFVYWDPTDPKACLAPDAFVRMGGPSSLPPSYKTWEHGAPHLAVEIISSSDARDRDQDDKLERYRHCGIAEVVFFDPANDVRPLRIWDLVEAGDLVERDLTTPEATRCKTLDAYLCVQPDAQLGKVMHLAADAAGRERWLTPAEVEKAAKEAALARVAELEAELARR
jgi:Uma2 family endonuclease